MRKRVKPTPRPRKPDPAPQPPRAPLGWAIVRVEASGPDSHRATLRHHTSGNEIAASADDPQDAIAAACEHAREMAA